MSQESPAPRCPRCDSPHVARVAHIGAASIGSIAPGGAYPPARRGGPGWQCTRCRAQWIDRTQSEVLGTDCVDSVGSTAGDYLILDQDADRDFQQHGDLGSHTVSEIDSRGTGRFTAFGRPPQQETGSDHAAQILASVWSRSGQDWSARQATKEDNEPAVDAYLYGPNKQVQRAQVTRVMPRDVWEEMATGATASRGIDAKQAADHLFTAYSAKSRVDSKNMVLILDARQPGLHSSTPTIQAFRATYGPTIRSNRRWQEIWIIGYRLDDATRVDIE